MQTNQIKPVDIVAEQMDTIWNSIVPSKDTVIENETDQDIEERRELTEKEELINRYGV